MSVFKKSCFSCGKKVDTLNEGMCDECYVEKFPPIKEIKPLNVKICNQCGKIHFNNSLYKVEDFEKIVPDVMKKKVVLNEGYKMNSLHIKDFEIESNKLKFGLEVDSDFK